MRKQTFWFSTRSDTNQAVQVQKMVRFWKFRLDVVEVLYHPSSEKKKAMISFAGYHEADLRFVFAYTELWFSHDTAQICTSPSFVMRKHT